MDQPDNSNSLDKIYLLLALCARAEGHSIFYEQLARHVEEINNWQEVPRQAELHGMAPLLWYHIHQSGVPIPRETERTLKGLYYRHRKINQVYTQALLEITTLFERSGIQALVLKGLALAYHCYPDPALRPVSDIDFLLRREDMLPALTLLAEAGFHTDLAYATKGVIPKELVANTPPRDGIRMRVELHYFDPTVGPLSGEPSVDNEFKGFGAPPNTLLIDGQTIYVPPLMDTLRYLTRHLSKHLFGATDTKPLQLKWVADLISLLERHVDSIDWVYLQQNHPDILKRLEVFYSLTPLPERFADIMPVRQIPPPQGLNRYPQGWPKQAFSQSKQTGFLRFLAKTFSRPSAWWLCLYYGIDAQSVFWYGQVIYRLQIQRRMLRVLFNKLGFARF